MSIIGPQSVLTSSAHQYTVTVTGGPASVKGGFDLKASAGTLTAGTNNRVSGTEVTHTNANTRSWTFTWTAPATAGTQNFWAIALAADVSGNESGDQWNWYGGVVNTAFPITVTNATGVGDEAALTWLAPPTPNPCTSSARVAFSLASAAPVRLELLDAAGRLVRTLAQGTMPAGRQSVSWDGRSSGGSRTPAGVYFVHMTTPQRNLVTRVTVLD